MILQVNAGTCLSFIEIGGILFLGALLGFAICYVLSKNPTTGLAAKLISNGEALEMIGNYQGPNYDKTASGHIEIGILLAYIDSMKQKCKANGKTLSGLEYYFAKYGSGQGDNSGLNTIVIYPTHEVPNGHIPFDPELDVNVIDMNNQFKEDKQNKKEITGGSYDTRNVLNRTHMSPPRPPLTL